MSIVLVMLTIVLGIVVEVRVYQHVMTGKPVETWQLAIGR